MNQMQHEKLVGQAIVDISRLHLDSVGLKNKPTVEFYSEVWKSAFGTMQTGTLSSFNKATAHLAVVAVEVLVLHKWMDESEKGKWVEKAQSALVWGENMRRPLFRDLEKRIAELISERENAKFEKAMEQVEEMHPSVLARLRKACLKPEDVEATVPDEKIEPPVVFNEAEVAKTMDSKKPSVNSINRKCAKAYKTAIDSGTDPETADEIAAALAAELGGEWKSKNTRKGKKAEAI